LPIDAELFNRMVERSTAKDPFSSLNRFHNATVNSTVPDRSRLGPAFSARRYLRAVTTTIEEAQRSARDSRPRPPFYRRARTTTSLMTNNLARCRKSHRRTVLVTTRSLGISADRLTWKIYIEFKDLTGGADGTRTRAKSNKISRLLNRKDPDSPFDPYDPQVLHQISHYLRVSETRHYRPSRHCS
jgi:hypothetical protein